MTDAPHRCQQGSLVTNMGESCGGTVDITSPGLRRLVNLSYQGLPNARMQEPGPGGLTVSPACCLTRPLVFFIAGRWLLISVLVAVVKRRAALLELLGLGGRCLDASGRARPSLRPGHVARQGRSAIRQAKPWLGRSHVALRHGGSTRGWSRGLILLSEYALEIHVAAASEGTSRIDGKGMGCRAQAKDFCGRPQHGGS